MKLSDIFDQLAYGELSQLALVADGEIIPKDVNRIIAQVNMGLAELHKRFMLKRKTLTLQALDDVIRYPLLSKYAESKGAELPYILDKDEPFSDDIIEILSVHDENGRELALNTHQAMRNEYSVPEVFTPAFNILRFAEDPVGKYTVTYKAGHPQLAKITDVQGFDPSKVDIELPMTHLEALLFYIASRVITPINGTMNGAPQEGMNYAQRFEQACMLLLQQGLDVEESRESSRFVRNGFV
ncbi:hypothetical protein NYZ29_17295 [Acinetobacter baumannii]|nr:hypothetical protein [Acinetobacter baumannii]